MADFFKKNRFKCIAAVIVLGMLAFTYFWGGGSPSEQTAAPSPVSPTPLPSAAFAPAPTGVITGTDSAENVTGADETATPLPDEETPAEPTALPAASPVADAGIPAGQTCTLSIRCDKLLPLRAGLSPEQAALVPPDGTILAVTPVEVDFDKKESAFDILKRVTKERGIHLEFVGESAYIEGIGNLYEFDFGNKSGWVYKVNGKMPQVSSAAYTLQPGDTVEFVYSLDFGRDIEGGSLPGNGV